MKFFLILLLSLSIDSQLFAADYYLDALLGDDIIGNGSQQNPWRSLNKTQSVAGAGDTVYLKTGDYGAYTEANVSRNSWTTYAAMTGADVHIDYIHIANTSPANTYLIFSGIEILPDDVVQTIAPQLPTSTQQTYNKTENAVSLTNVNYFQVNNSVISGRNHWYTTELVYAASCNYLTFKNNEVKTSWHAFRFVTSGSNIIVSGCNIHDLTGTAINTVGIGYSNMLYQFNHIHDTDIAPYTEDYAPKANGADIHGSCISIRDGGTTIRNNIMRRCGSSSGIMFYEDDAGNDYVNENILMENNLIYDTPALHPVRILELGPNVVIRNNTIIGEDYGSSRYQYRTAVLVEGIDAQNGPPSLSLYNNIFIGILDMNTYSSYITATHNIFWSVLDDSTWLCEGDAFFNNDVVYACGSGDPSDPQSEMEALFVNENNLAFTPDHGKELDFTMARTSTGWNYGDPTLQPTNSLGSLKGGFLRNDGTARSSTRHSVGAYEAGISNPKNLKVQP